MKTTKIAFKDAGGGAGGGFTQNGKSRVSGKDKYKFNPNSS